MDTEEGEGGGGFPCGAVPAGDGRHSRGCQVGQQIQHLIQGVRRCKQGSGFTHQMDGWLAYLLPNRGKYIIYRVGCIRFLLTRYDDVRSALYLHIPPTRKNP